MQSTPHVEREQSRQHPVFEDTLSPIMTDLEKKLRQHPLQTRHHWYRIFVISVTSPMVALCPTIEQHDEDAWSIPRRIGGETVHVPHKMQA